MRAITEWHDVDRQRFESEIQSQYQPAVLRGVVASWPAVERGRASAQSLREYLAARDNGSEVDATRDGGGAMVGAPWRIVAH